MQPPVSLCEAFYYLPMSRQHCSCLLCLVVGIYKETHLVLLLVHDCHSQSHDTSLSHTAGYRTAVQYEPKAPGPSMQRQTVVFHSQRALKSQIYASREKPH